MHVTHQVYFVVVMVAVVNIAGIVVIISIAVVGAMDSAMHYQGCIGG